MRLIGYIFLPAVAGIGLGTFYFGGLWLTLSRLMTTRNPLLLTLGSYLGRLALSFLGFYMVARAAEWQGLLVCLAFFLFVRTFMVRRWGKPVLAARGSGRTIPGEGPPTDSDLSAGERPEQP